MNSDLHSEDHGPVRWYRMTRRILGRRVMNAGVYVVGKTLIDTGPRSCAALAEEVLRIERIDQIVLTHHHEDHAGNAALAARRTGHKPYIHRAGVDLVARPPRLPWYRDLLWGTPEPVAAAELDDTVEVEGARFTVIEAPGHAVDQITLYEPDRGWLFSADVYLTDRFTRAFRYENVADMIASLRRLLALPDCEMFCSHTGQHASHQNRLGRRLDFVLGLRDKAIVYFEEGCSLGEITRRLDIADGMNRWITGDEWTSRELVRQLLEDAGKFD